MLESDTIHIDVDQLKVSTREVGRYAGGSRYKLDGKMSTLASQMIQRANQLAVPVFTYTVHPIKSFDPQKGFQLANGNVVEAPPEEKDVETVSLAAVVCTLGAALEVETHRLMQSGELLTAMFLDAAGVAQLEKLAHNARRHVKKRAAGNGLFSGCPFGPGYNGIPLDSQNCLFASVDAERINVKLNSSGVMLPMKSISFWLRITRDKNAAEDHGYKCQKCDMENCLYRKVPFKSGAA
jgi:hypothetical protein